MPVVAEKTTREQIVDAADELFYQRGYEHTSFSDIAKKVRISRGNFYFHFKSKDELLGAVIGLRLAHRQKMLDRWERDADSPEGRIREFIHILIANEGPIQRYGCPVGTLCTELAKLGHPLWSESTTLFTLFRTWLRDQFTQLGHKQDADVLALHLLARSQGVAALAHAFHDVEFIRYEVRQMCDWLSSLTTTAVRSRAARGRVAGERSGSGLKP
jgi:TetR/AcrR family transcriptional regulator, transcriptional repressor for nem operon